MFEDTKISELEADIARKVTQHEEAITEKGLILICDPEQAVTLNFWLDDEIEKQKNEVKRGFAINNGYKEKIADHEKTIQLLSFETCPV